MLSKEHYRWQHKGFIRDINLCVIRAGKFNDAEGGKINPNLKMVYAIASQVCDTYKSHGENTLVGRYIHNVWESNSTTL